MLSRLRGLAKHALAPILYRYPPIGLQPTELGIYLHELLARAAVPGDVAEIGCSVGGTACLAAAVVRQHAPGKTYICHDTFDGFVPGQFAVDERLGTPGAARAAFRGTSRALVRRILDLHGCPEVRLVQGDIVSIPDSALSPAYSVVLLDVDLSEPTHAALVRVHPRLSQGGIILVDDCRQDPGQRWKASLGYQRFCAEAGIAPCFHCGFGVIER